MALIIDEMFEYRHKKFDQCKRSRTSSFSSTDDYECIRVEIERLDDDQPLMQHSMNTSSTISYNEHQSMATTLPPSKRRRTTSTTNSDTSYATSYSPASFLPLRYTSTPIDQSNTVAIAPPAAILPKISQDIENLDDDQSLMQQSFSSTISYSEATPSPPCKRRRTTSTTNSDTSYATSYSPAPFVPPRYTSTPINQSNTVAIAPPTDILPKISEETLHNICKYHGNMVRKFPKKERTPKEQERRNKNTIACRMSRRVKKLEHVAIEEQYKEFSKQTFDIIEQAMRSTAYLHQLMKLSDDKNNDILNAKVKDIQMEPLEEAGPTTSSQHKIPFSIEYLLGKRK